MGTDGTAAKFRSFAAALGIDEIEQNNRALTPNKYIEFIDHAPEIGCEKKWRVSNPK